MAVALATQSKAHPRAARGRDLYKTSPVAVNALLAVERLPIQIWEPAAGNRAIVRALIAAGHRVVGTDIASGTDFLKCRVPRARAIVTNPPYLIAAQFAAHAIRLCPFVAMLMRLGFLEAGNDRSEAGRARLFCLDQRPPARVHVFRNRLPMMHRHGWRGRKASSAMAFAWIIWDAGHSGPTELARISWEDNK
jgi:hypothetical protein